MSELFDVFQSLMDKETSDYSGFVHHVKRCQEQMADLELARSYGLLRLAQALQFWSEKAEGSKDVLVLLRQVIRSYERGLIVRMHLWQQLTAGESVPGLWSIGESDTTGMVQVRA